MESTNMKSANLSVINRKNIVKNITMLLIALYISGGFIKPFFEPSREDFYADLYEKSESYAVYLLDSGDFEGTKSRVSNRFVPEIIQCLKSEPVKYVSLGGHKQDRFLNFSLVSSEYRYDLAFKWRTATGLAYISGVERRTKLEDSDVVSKSGFGRLGGACFGSLFSNMLL